MSGTLDGWNCVCAVGSSSSHAELTGHYALQRGNRLLLMQAACQVFFLKVTLLFRICLSFQEIKGITLIFKSKIQIAYKLKTELDISCISVYLPSFQDGKESCDGNQEGARQFWFLYRAGGMLHTLFWGS